ncbi:hypothetical protein PR048_021484 [Dryococelus australis]|uniref:PiggyBac transposable element-derived protein 4 C-terminal zinc-finger domain-containing protein n=1 Tax=Dryococelus australis TaxID=614101 RepID=A0ABQ9GYE6_9NEOP|nr:hypothetical protein PR048_021484 [Dryococelus australis]
MVKYYPKASKIIKWTKKVVFNLFLIGAYNAIVVMKEHTGVKLKFVDFLSQCIEGMTTTPIETNSHQLLEDSDNSSNCSPSVSPVARPSVQDTASRLLDGVKNHSLVKIPQVGKRTNTLRQCRVCSVKDSEPKRISFVCSSCNNPLCPDGCFSRYHSVKHIKK